MSTILGLDYLAFAVAWVVGAWLVGVTAGKRGFNPLAWGLFSLIASPVAGVVLLALVTPRQPRSGG